MPFANGKVQVGLYQYDQGYGPVFINQLKSAKYAWRLLSSNSVVSGNQYWWTQVDDDGYPTAAPVTAGDFWAMEGVDVVLAIGDTIVLDWQGSAVLSLTSTTGGSPPSLTYNPVGSTATKKRYTVTASSFSATNGVLKPYVTCAVRMTSFGTCSNARLYLESMQSYLDAGEVLVPALKDRCSGWKIMRMMDWMQTNGVNRASFTSQKPASYHTYAGQKIDNTIYSGVATYSAHPHDITVPTRSGFTALTDGYQISFTAAHDWCAEKIVSAGTVDGSGTIILTCANHGLVTGDYVIFPRRTSVPNSGNGNWITMGQLSSTTTPTSSYSRWRDRQVTVIDANTFSIDGQNASTWGAYPFTGSANNLLKFVRRPTITYGGTTYPVVGPVGWSFNGTPSGSFKPHIAQATFDIVWQRWKCGGLTDANYAPGSSSGVPLDVMLRICKDAGSHPWFNIPVQFTDEAIIAFMQYVKNWIDANAPWMVPRFELSNETWNTGTFTAGHFLGNRADYGGVAGDNLDEHHGYFTNRLVDAANAVWSDRSKRKISLMWQNAMTQSRVDDRLKCTSRYGNNQSLWPANRIDVIGAASYINPTFTSQRSYLATDYPGLVNAVYGYLQGGAQREAAFDWMRAEFSTPSTPSYGDPNRNFTISKLQSTSWLTRTNALAAYPHLEWEEYEGGFGHNGSDGLAAFDPVSSNDNTMLYGFPIVHAASGTTITVQNARDFVFDFRRSTQAGGVVTDYCEAIEAAGGTPAFYCLQRKLEAVNGMWTITAPYDQSGVENIPSYTAAKAFNAGTETGGGDPTSFTAICTL